MLQYMARAFMRRYTTYRLKSEESSLGADLQPKLGSELLAKDVGVEKLLGSDFLDEALKEEIDEILSDDKEDSHG